MATKYMKLSLPADQGETLPPVHLEAAGVKMTLPNIMGSDIPIEILTAMTAYMSAEQQGEPSQEANTVAMASIVEYLRKNQPEFINALSKEGHAVNWITAVAQAWFEQSGADPKSE